MARFRISIPAQADLRQILETSEQRWGRESRRRYAAILAAAMRKVAADPQGPTSRERADLMPSLRSMHLTHARRDDSGATVNRPAHVLYYRIISPGFVEIVRVLHERSEPGRHIK